MLSSRSWSLKSIATAPVVRTGTSRSASNRGRTPMLHQGRPDQENKMRPHALRRARIEARRGRGHGRCPTRYWVCPTTRPQDIVINPSTAQVTKRKIGEPYVAHPNSIFNPPHSSTQGQTAKRTGGEKGG